VAPSFRSGFDSARDLLLFFAGIALGVYGVTREPPSEGLVTLAVGLCIAPAALLPGRTSERPTITERERERQP
jgi:hypothetical protein